mgnify:CR=1 FL=1
MKTTLLKLFFLFIPLFYLSQNTTIDTGNKFITLSFKDKDFENAYNYLDASITSSFKLSDLQNLVGLFEGQNGNFKNIIEISPSKKENAYLYYCEFEKTKIDLMISFNESKLINGFYFIPHKDSNISTK